MISTLKTDIAPSEPHIALRRNGVCYYAPALLHLSPTFNHIVPMTISDVLLSKSVLEIYGVPGIKMHTEGYIMVKNYPVQLLKVRGRLLLYTQISYPGKPSFYILKLDDYLGYRLSITVKAKCTLFVQELREGVIMEVIGKIKYLPRYIQIDADTAQVKGHFSQFELELEWWKIVFSARKFLEVPWNYQAPDQESTPGLVKFQMADVIKKQQKRKILVSIGEDDEEEDLSLFVDADDCMIGPNWKSSSNENKPQKPVIIDLSEED